MASGRLPGVTGRVTNASGRGVNASGRVTGTTGGVADTTGRLGAVSGRVTDVTGRQTDLLDGELIYRTGNRFTGRRTNLQPELDAVGLPGGAGRRRERVVWSLRDQRGLQTHAT